MGRHKNTNWTVPDTKTVPFEAANTAVLMDIRDELQAIRRLLECPNTIRVPRILDKIAEHTKPKRRRKKKGGG